MLNMNLQLFAHKKGVGSSKNGPPAGTYFSRLKEMKPSPPLPLLTYILALSANIVALFQYFHSKEGLSYSLIKRELVRPRTAEIPSLRD